LKYICESDLSLARVAFLLGYAQPASLQPWRSGAGLVRRLQIERGDNASIITLHALGFIGPLV
jgi:hypothetical protein